jgi:hypothetical protein
MVWGIKDYFLCKRHSAHPHKANFAGSKNRLLASDMYITENFVGVLVTMQACTERASIMFSKKDKLFISVQKKSYNLEQLVAQHILDIAYATQPYVLYTQPTEVVRTYTPLFCSLLECITDRMPVSFHLPPMLV